MTQYNEIMELVSEYGIARYKNNPDVSIKIYEKICDIVLKITNNK